MWKDSASDFNWFSDLDSDVLYFCDVVQKDTGVLTYVNNSICMWKDSASDFNWFSDLDSDVQVKSNLSSLYLVFVVKLEMRIS